MSTFDGSLQLDFGNWQHAGRIAITLCPVIWIGERFSVIIPSGYMSDGASVPRFFWTFLPPWGDRATFGALLHDYLLDRLQGFEPGGAVPGAETRKACDDELLAALMALQVPRWRAFLVWLGVRAHSIRLTILKGKDRPLAAESLGSPAP